MRHLVVLSLLLCTACGAGLSQPVLVEVEPCAGAPALDVRFSGAREGRAVLEVSGAPARAYASAVDMGLHGYSAVLSQVCPTGAGSVEVAGAGPTARWEGSLDCPAFRTPECPALALRYTSVHAYLDVEGALHVDGAGLAGGCGEPVAFVTRFTSSGP